jgi:4-amino-4-deoxy-L-arabinose transferase-like glycosyltransferase
MNPAVTNAGMPTWRKYLPGVGLLCIFISYVIAIVRLHPTNFFGQTEDDSIYFSSAKAIAEGKGYILASFPGTPIATKYPVFYPWLLSWVWRWNPSFPANLRDAIAITVLFGLIFLGAAYLLLRQMRGINDYEALLLTGFCALHPLVLFYSANLLSEIPFAALALLTMLVAEKALKHDARTSTVICCGVLAGLSMLLRMFGVPVAMGVLLALLIGRAWRQAVVFCACVAPFFAAVAWRAIFPHGQLQPVSGAAASSLGWVHEWTYYTNYLNVWKQGIPDSHVFFAMLSNNAAWFVIGPANYFVHPTVAPNALLGWFLALAVVAGILAGTIREIRANRLRPIHLVFLFYALLTLLWNYPQAERFLIPFMPLFAAGLWIEAKNVATLAGKAILGSRPLTEKIVASALGVLLVLCGLAAAVDYTGGLRKAFARESDERATLLPDKREAYNWISRSTAPDARIVAYEAGSLYLYSNRVVVPPIILTTAEFYEPARLPVVMQHITDVPRAVGAEYWLTADDDYRLEWPEARKMGRAKSKELERMLPLVYRSPHNHVRIYSLDCIQHPDSPGCESVRKALFASDGTITSDNLP